MQLLCTPTSMARKQVKDRQPIYIMVGHQHDSFPQHTTFPAFVFTPTPVTIQENITLPFDSRNIPFTRVHQTESMHALNLQYTRCSGMPSETLNARAS
jgi:hypothetical protein